MTEYEQDIVSIISSSGESKAKAFEALKYAKLGDFNKARVLLKESREIKKKGIEKLSFLKNLKRQILKAFAPLM